MKNLVFRRLTASAVVLVLASTMMFGLSRGPIESGFGFDYINTERWGEQYRLDRSYPAQYFDWMFRTVRLDFGQSSYVVGQDGGASQSRTVISKRIWKSAQILLGAFAFAIFTGVPLGALASKSPGSAWDKAGHKFASIGQVTPIFILAFLLIFALFHVRPGILVFQGGFDTILPSVSLGWFIAAAFYWRTRAAILEADAEGRLSEVGMNGEARTRATVVRVISHLIDPPTTFAFMPAAYIIAGLLMFETWFATPGLGQLAVQSFARLDFPVIYAITMLTTAAILGLIWILEVLSELLRPCRRPAPREIIVAVPNVSEQRHVSPIFSVLDREQVARFPVISAITIALTTFCAVFAPILAPHDPVERNYQNRDLPPFSRGTFEESVREQSNFYVLGTDGEGRDELSRIIWSAWVYLAVIGTALVGGAVGGILMGTAVGFLGSGADKVLSWLLEFTMAVPLVFLLLAFSFRYGSSVDLLAILLLLYVLPTFAAFTRNEIRRMRATRAVAGTQEAESPTLVVEIKEYSPSVARSTLVAAAMMAGPLILIVSMLGSINISNISSIPTWGSVFRDSFNPTPGLDDATLLLSGLAVVITVIAANSLGNWLNSLYSR